jgi:hypothetical protein
MGAMKIKLRTTLQTIDEIYEAVDSVRGKWIEVDKATLLALLMDHSAMYGKLIDIGVPINAREKATKKVKL